jgi:phosphoribosylamine--glycine ligase
MPDGVLLFHAGTKFTDEGRLVTTGGRIMAVTGTGADLTAAVAVAYDAVRRIYFDGMQYRTDIGARIIRQDL